MPYKLAKADLISLTLIVINQLQANVNLSRGTGRK